MDAANVLTNCVLLYFPADISQAVTVTEVHIMSIPSGRTDYVVQGESVQLSCHYIFNKPHERVVAVNWKKDGKEVEKTSCLFLILNSIPILQVYISTPNKRPIALALFRGHVDFNSRDLLNTVSLFNVTIQFAGQYSCRVITDYNESENASPLTVVVGKLPEGGEEEVPGRFFSKGEPNVNSMMIHI